ncbi:MAG: DNA primase [Gammaproteobacteria bacterium]|nr:DNA primase [Gammaproteobacteria bacterium]
MPQTFIDDLLARTDIVDVVEERVPIKSGGRDYMGCCPFHEEKTPSFSVSREKQFYYCFGCHASGNALGFVMNYDGLGFVEAIEELAGRLGMDIPREADAQPRVDHSKLYDLLNAASKFYQSQLRRHPDAARAVAYLKERGLDGKTAARYDLGFAPPGWDNLATHLSNGRNDADMELAGLVSPRPKGSGVYDRLRDRIVFPIHDKRGQVIGFGGRTIAPDDTPKYLNSPETPVFHKGRELYGLHQARQSQRRPEYLLVVEGYLDVVALAQFGIDTAVATLGTAITADHANALFRVTQHVVFCFDGDGAGGRAAWRALETVLPELREGRSASFLFMPDGEDPDSFVRSEGADALRERISTSTPLSEFLFSHLSENLDISTIEGRSRLAESASPLIEKIPAGAYRTLLDQKLSELTQIRGNKLTMLNDNGRRTPPRRSSESRAPQPGAPSLVRQGIRLLLHDPSLASRAPVPELTGLERQGIDLLRELLALCRDSPDLSTGRILERYREHAMGPHLAKLAAGPSPILEAGLEDEFSGILAKLAAERIEQRYRYLAQQAEAHTLTDEEKREFRHLLEQLNSKGNISQD